MAMPIMVATSTTALKPPAPTRSSKRGGAKAGPSPRERVIVYEGSSGPRELMESIVIQAQAALKGLGGMEQHADSRTMTEEEKRQTTLSAADPKGKGKAHSITSDDNAKLRTFWYE